MKASGAAVLGLLASSPAVASTTIAQSANAGSDSNATGPTKTRATYYTEEERAAALANIEQFDWAKEERDMAIKKADTYLELFTLDDLWNYVGSQKIPRASWLAGGNAGYYPSESEEWSPPGLIGDATYLCKPGMQWKFTNGEYTLPTNDFENYRQSGLDDRGCFDPALASDSLLVNEKHPEMGEQWGVDDGTGWVDENGDLGPDGQRWVPVAWAHHWSVVYGYREVLKALYHAYLYTEEQPYARAVSVILDRVGDVYPGFSLQDTVYFDDGGYTERNGFPNNSHGGTGRGKQVGSIWEAYWIKSVLRGYDAVWPAQTGDTKLQEFLKAKATKYPSLAPKDSISDIRANIESGLVQEVLPATKNAQLRGNFGSHQSTLGIAAVIQDDPDGYTTETLDFLFEAGGLKNEDDGTAFGRWYITGGDVLPSLLSTFDRDGHAYEGTVHYNSLVASAIQGVGDVLSDYDGYDGTDLYENVIFKQMFKTQAPLTYLNNYVPHYGDTEGAGSPGFDEMIEGDDLVSAYERYDDSAAITERSTDGKGELTSADKIDLAQWIHLRNGKTTNGLRGEIFDPDPTSVRHDIQAVIDREGPLDLNSTQLAGFGFTALRAGDAETNGRGIWTYYGRNAHGPDEGYGTSHAHHDTLTIGVFAHGLNLTPDLGYPEETGSWPKRDNWTANTISHNTVSVNETPQGKQWVAEPKGFDHTERVQLFDVDASNVYDEASQYRRTVAQIEIDTDSSYAVDFFRVTGGEDHHYSFHGSTAKAVKTSGLTLTKQENGTYAGPNVEKPGHGEDTTYNDAVGNGFNYLFNVERDADPSRQFSVDWDVTDYWNARDDSEERSSSDSRAAERSTATERRKASQAVGRSPTTSPSEGCGNLRFPRARKRSAFSRTRLAARSLRLLATQPGDTAEGVHLRLTMLGENSDVALADGTPPQRWGNPEKFKYVLAHRAGTNLESVFTAVIEPYERERHITRISEAEVVSTDDSARAVTVELANGRTDYIVSATDPEADHVVEDSIVVQGTFAVYSEQDRRPEHAYLHNGKKLIAGGEPLILRSQGRIDGTVESFTKELSMQNELTVSVSGSGREDITDAVGRWIYLTETAEKRNGAYEIKGSEKRSGNIATLDLGEQTTVKEFKDDSDIDAGYTYIPKEGSPFTIPLSSSWSR